MLIFASLSRYQHAYELHLPEMIELAASALQVVNLDIPTATTLVHARLPGIRELRPEVVAHLPTHDLGRFDALETCARALSYAHARYRVAAAPPAVLPALNEAALSLRRQLAEDAKALARRELIAPDRILGLRGSVGYEKVAYDLMALASLLREHWPSIAGMTAISLAEIERAERLSDELLTALASRGQRSHEVAEASHDRQRAFTLFVGTYDHVRRAVTYLRWKHGDAELIAPSLYAGRSNGRGKSRRKSEPLAEASASPPAESSAAPDDLAEPIEPPPALSSSPRLPAHWV